MAESYWGYEVTGDAGPGFPPYHWMPTTNGELWTERSILEMAEALRNGRVAKLKTRRRLIEVGEWEDVDG